MNERIAIVYPFPNLDSVPSLTDAAEMLAETGYRVDVFTKVGSGYLPPRFSHPSIEVLTKRPRRERRGFHRLLPARWSYPLQVRGRHRRAPYRAAIGVDPQGLVEARALFRRVPCPVVYFSLEILIPGPSPRQQAWKKTEVEMAEKAPFVIVQDAERAELLRRSTALELSECVLVPNAPAGPGRRRPSRYWHRRFSLADGERVVLHAGSLEAWTGIDEIVASTPGWPPGFRLVVHSRSAAGEEDPRVAALRRLGGGERLHFSLRPVPREAYDDLVDGADVGVAFYDPELDPSCVDLNSSVLGLSSGKLAYYLRAGLPVVVNDKASVGDLVRDWGCGLAVSSGGELAAALLEIAADREGYSRRALAAFAEHLDFRRAFGEVLRRLERLEKENT